MSELWGHVVGVLIVTLMTMFVGIWWWAWRPRHKAAFDSLAELPMFESEGPGTFADPDLPTLARYGGPDRAGTAA